MDTDAATGKIVKSGAQGKQQKIFIYFQPVKGSQREQLRIRGDLCREYF